MTFFFLQTTIHTLIGPLFTILSRAPEAKSAQGKLYSKGSPFHFLLFQGNIQNRTCPKGPPFGFFSALCDFFSCMCWVHRRCSKIRGSLNSARNFVCVSCAKPTDPVTSEEDFGELGRVDKFVYLGHSVNASGGYEDAVSHRVQSAWYAFRRLRGTLVGKHGLSLRQRGFIYSRCVRPVLLYSCETWSLTTNLKLRLQSTERRMVRMMCGVRLVDCLPSEELRRRLGIQPDVIECQETSILRWFGHVVRQKDTHPIKAAHNFSVTGKRPPGRPKKTWDNAVRELLKARRRSEVDALNRVFWRSTIQGRPANLSHWQLGQGGNR